MSSQKPSDVQELMQAVLKPLLHDFQHWFQRSLELFESEAMVGLTSQQQADLIEQVKTALGEAQTAETLLQATDGQVGVEASKVMTWHRLVHECWGIARRHRQGTASDSP